MKGKIVFLLPRLIAITLIAGIASLVLGFVFKLLLGVIIFGSAALGIATIAKKLGDRGERHSRNAMVSINGMQPSAGYQQQYQPSSQRTIIPIN